MGLSSWPGAGSISPHHAPSASSAQTLQLEASTCRLCSLWSTMTPPSTCGPMCIGEGWPLVLGGGPQRETAVPRPLEGWGPHWTGGGLLVFRVGRTARAGKTGQAFTLLLKVQVSPWVSVGMGALLGTLQGEWDPSCLCASLQERRFLQMLADAGAPELQRHDSPSELLQPLVPRYEEALSQLERAVKVGHSTPPPPPHGEPDPGFALVLTGWGMGWARPQTTEGGTPCALPSLLQEERKQKAT